MQSTADPRWRLANQMITDGKIGHVMQGQTSYYRNSNVGQWRYYQLTKEMNPKTIDWKMFLGTEFGLAPEQPFNRARYAQWRCYWDFGGGMYTDLFVHQLTHLILAMGVRFPRRVVGAGGLYLEYDGRDVPDMATVVADYDEGCQVLISATMCNDVQLPEVIRGHTATMMFESDARTKGSGWFSRSSGPAGPSGQQRGEGGETVQAATQPRRGHLRALGALPRMRPLAEPRDALPGRARLCGDHDGQPGRPVVPRRQGLLLRQGDRRGHTTPMAPGPPAGKSAASSAASPTRSSAGRPATEGSLLKPPDYQKLEGDWVDGKDPGRNCLIGRPVRSLASSAPEGGSVRDPLSRVASSHSSGPATVRRISRVPTPSTQTSLSTNPHGSGGGRPPGSRARPASRPARGGRETGGVGRDGRDRLLDRPAGGLEQVPTPGLEPLVRPGQVRRAGHDDLARRVDGPLAVSARRQPGQRAGVADQDGPRRPLGPREHAQACQVEMVAVGDERRRQLVERSLVPDRVGMAGQGRGDAVAQVRAQPRTGRDGGADGRAVGRRVPERHHDAVGGRLPDERDRPGRSGASVTSAIRPPDACWSSWNRSQSGSRIASTGWAPR